jgi:hypothetical protein
MGVKFGLNSYEKRKIHGTRRENATGDWRGDVIMQSAGFVCLTNCYSDDQTKGGEMGGSIQHIRGRGENIGFITRGEEIMLESSVK